MNESLLQNAIAHLAALVRENGWPCAVSEELGKFRGPGKKSDACPYATLQMLNLLQKSKTWRDGTAAKGGAQALLDLWENSLEKHPYIFYMGTDFCKLKAPLVWYDIVSVADALSKCAWIHEDKRFIGILLHKSKGGQKRPFYPGIRLCGHERLGFRPEKSAIRVADFLCIQDTAKNRI